MTADPAAARVRRPGPRRALTEDEILDAALDLLDDGGTAAARPGYDYDYGDEFEFGLDLILDGLDRARHTI